MMSCAVSLLPRQTVSSLIQSTVADAMYMLLEHGAPIEERWDGMTPLMGAAYKGNIRMVKEVWGHFFCLLLQLPLACGCSLFHEKCILVA